jgi:hypothetical protein
VRTRRSCEQDQATFEVKWDDSNRLEVFPYSEIYSASRVTFPIGTRVSKIFTKERKWYEGSVDKVYTDDPLMCHIKYNDGDEEDMHLKELLEVIAYHRAGAKGRSEILNAGAY